MLRNKVRYLLLLASAGLLGVLYNTYSMGILFLTVLCIPVFMFGLLCYVYGMLKAELGCTAHVVNKKDPIPVTIHINNPTIFPVSNIKVYLEYKNSYSRKKYKKELSLSIDGKTKTTLTVHLYSDYAGNLRIKLKGIRVYDYLKMFSLKKRIKGEVNAAVLPSYYELPENYISNRHTRLVESDHYSPYRSGDDPSEVFAVREYREGDRLQRIHWKLSSKQGQLMIKEFSDPINCAVLLLVNLCVPQGESQLAFLDAILESSLSLSYTFLRQKQIHYFVWFDVKHGCCTRVRISEEAHLFEALDGLLQAAPYEEKVDAVTPYIAEHPNDQYTDLFYVTGEISTSKLDLLSFLRTQSRQIIYVGSKEHAKSVSLPEDLIERSNDMGIDLWPVDRTNLKHDMENIRADAI